MINNELFLVSVEIIVFSHTKTYLNKILLNRRIYLNISQYFLLYDIIYYDKS